MTGIIESIVMERFWDGWEDKLLQEKDRLITPNSKEVINETKTIGFENDMDKLAITKKIWTHVERTVDWTLDKEWQSPDKLLTTRRGDCEAMCFLILSMLPNAGVYDGELVIGNLIRPSGRGGPHVWIEVDGVVMDPTGTQESVKDMEYEEVNRFKIEYGAECISCQ